MMDSLYALPINLAVCIFLLGCVLLDVFFGDPQDWPHPVRLLGSALQGLEGWGRGFWLGPSCGGAISVLGLTACTGLVVWGLVSLPMVGDVLAVYLGYAGLALGCLSRETTAVSALLEHNRLDQARERLAGLVSRDTGPMSREDMYRAVGETLAENFNDGFVAPFFYLAFFGPVALWMYKAISTADSMWGYRSARFEQLGKARPCLMTPWPGSLLVWLPRHCGWLGGFACVLCPGHALSLKHAVWTAPMQGGP